MWISEELEPFLFWHAALVPPPPLPLGAVVPVLQALKDSTAIAASAPTLESFIQSPPQAGRPASRSTPVGTPGSSRPRLLAAGSGALRRSWRANPLGSSGADGGAKSGA